MRDLVFDRLDREGAIFVALENPEEVGIHVRPRGKLVLDFRHVPASVNRGRKLLVYEALSYWRMRPEAASV